MARTQAKQPPLTVSNHLVKLRAQDGIQRLFLRQGSLATPSASCGLHCHGANIQTS